jgi:hypothetical protein
MTEPFNFKETFVKRQRAHNSFEYFIFLIKWE